MGGLEKEEARLQAPLATARRERLDVLWSSQVQTLWERTPKSDTTFLLFRGSLVDFGLLKNAWGYVAPQVMKDLRKHLYNLLDTYLPRTVRKQLEAELRGREYVNGKTFNVVVHHLLQKTRGGRMDKEEGGRWKRGSLEGRNGRRG